MNYSVASKYSSLAQFVFSLTSDKILLMVDYIIEEPKFSDAPIRCFKLPFTAAEALCTDTELIRRELVGNIDTFPVLTKMFSFFRSEDMQGSSKRGLNITLGGYINKVASYWLIKEPQVVLHFIIRQNTIVSGLFNNLYLTHCVTDILIRLCTVR